MDIHIRQFAVMTIIYSAAAIVVGIATLVWSGGLPNLLSSSEETGFAAALTAIVLFNLALGPPSIVAAYFLMEYQNWARNMMIVISALNILNVPFGSMLGAYGLWVLMSVETEPLFLDPGPLQRARAAARSKVSPEKQKEQSHARIVPSKADSRS